MSKNNDIHFRLDLDFAKEMIILVVEKKGA
jgi:hypothetical protein